MHINLPTTIPKAQKRIVFDVTTAQDFVCASTHGMIVIIVYQLFLSREMERLCRPIFWREIAHFIVVQFVHIIICAKWKNQMSRTIGTLISHLYVS